jgi:hypothetical protein
MMTAEPRWPGRRALLARAALRRYNYGMGTRKGPAPAAARRRAADWHRSLRWPRRRSAIAAGLVSLLLTVGPGPAAAQIATIVGTWRGTSTCVDKEHFPACHDEQVIYEGQLTHSAPDTVTIRADKVLNGAREFMGELYFTPQGDGSWTTEVRMPRSHFLVTLRRVGDGLTGVMTDLSSGRRIRDIVLTRVP